MSEISRRKLITSGLAVAAGASGLFVGARARAAYGLIPPDPTEFMGRARR